MSFQSQQSSSAAAFCMALSASTYRKDNPVSDSSFNDNVPWASSTSFGKNSSADYYYLSDMSKYQLYKTCRYTEFGYRLTWGTNQDAWNNDFKLKFVEESEDNSKWLNEEIERQLRSVYFYDEIKKATGYDKEQGESLLFIHREGTELNDLETEEANINTPVRRVEAINFIDYTYGPQGEQGFPDHHDISFYTDRMQNQTFHPKLSHSIRIRTNGIDYDQYKGQPEIKPVNGSLQILLMITRAAGDAAFRWSLGIPAIGVKGINNTADIARIKSIIGNPTSQSWFIYPADKVTDIKPIGLGGSMMNLQQLADICINNICAQQKIPKSILIGDAVGVIEGSRVFERTYYAKLSNWQRSWRKYIRDYLYLDPVCRSIIGNRKYEIEFGLRQVMTEKEKADLNALYYANAEAISSFSTFNEVRREAHKSLWEEAFNTPEKRKKHIKIYGWEPEEIGFLPYEYVISQIFSPRQNIPEQKTDKEIPTDQDDLDNIPDDETLSKAKQKVADAVTTYKLLCPNAETFADTFDVSRNTGYAIINKMKRLLKVNQNG